MKFLVVMTSRTPPPPEMLPNIMAGMLHWIEQYQSKMDGIFGFAGIQGGCGIVNVDTADELDEIMVRNPFTPFSETRVYPLTDLKGSINRNQEVMAEMTATINGHG